MTPSYTANNVVPIKKLCELWHICCVFSHSTVVGHARCLQGHLQHVKKIIRYRSTSRNGSTKLLLFQWDYQKKWLLQDTSTHFLIRQYLKCSRCVEWEWERKKSAWSSFLSPREWVSEWVCLIAFSTHSPSPSEPEHLLGCEGGNKHESQSASVQCAWLEMEIDFPISQRSQGGGWRRNVIFLKLLHTHSSVCLSCLPTTITTTVSE